MVYAVLKDFASPSTMMGGQRGATGGKPRPYVGDLVPTCGWFWVPWDGEEATMTASVRESWVIITLYSILYSIKSSWLCTTRSKASRFCRMVNEDRVEATAVMNYRSHILTVQSFLFIWTWGVIACLKSIVLRPRSLQTTVSLWKSPVSCIPYSS